MINLRVILLTALAIASFTATVGAGTIKTLDGKTELGFYLEFSLINDRGIAWTGSEVTFANRVKVDLTHRLYDDIIVVANGVWAPTVNEHTIGRETFDKREGNPEDLYIQFNRRVKRPVDFRLGVVKVPFGHFNFMAFEDRNRPISFARTREWDYGVRMDTVINRHAVSLAIVNGDGIQGTDANSAKSIVLRVLYPVKTVEDAYPKTVEVTEYPNPLNTNPKGGFLWQAGISMYIGNKYSTPIKIRNTHYGLDFKIDYKNVSLKGQYTYHRGGFSGKGVSAATLNAEDLARADTSTFKDAHSFVTEAAVGVTPRIVVTVMAELYDPASGSDNSGAQKTKTRVVTGAKYDYRKDVSMAIFYTRNDDPGYEYVSANTGRGNNVYMMGVAARF